MKHIRYITSNKTVCEKPFALDSDFIVVDNGPVNEESCDPCLQIVMAHNKKQYERDNLINFPQRHSRASNEDPLGPSMGLFYSFLVISAFWITMFAIYIMLDKWG